MLRGRAHQHLHGYMPFHPRQHNLPPRRPPPAPSSWPPPAAPGTPPCSPAAPPCHGTPAQAEGDRSLSRDDSWVGRLHTPVNASTVAAAQAAEQMCSCPWLLDSAGQNGPMQRSREPAPACPMPCRWLATHRLRAAARHIRLQIRKPLALALTLGRHLSHQLAACGQEEWHSAVQRRQGAGRQTALGQGMQAAAGWVEGKTGHQGR